jgi:magnesium-transporting ATPase (P-type)
VFAASSTKSCAILLAPPDYVNRLDQPAKPRPRRRRTKTVAKTLIVSGITALLLIAFGVFWMFMWLVGTNGYNGSTGGAILACNLALVILSVIISSAASGWLTNKLRARLGWPMWAAAPVVIAGVLIVAVTILMVASIIIIAVADSVR